MHVLVKQDTGEEAEAFLIDVLPGNEFPNPNLIRRYYGDDAPLAAYGVFHKGRFVFRVTTGGYYVVMGTLAARRFWRFYGNQIA